jgi:hypothetical protein
MKIAEWPYQGSDPQSGLPQLAGIKANSIHLGTLGIWISLAADNKDQNQFRCSLPRIPPPGTRQLPQIPKQRHTRG